MGLIADILALPKEDQLDAALDALRDLLSPDMDLMDHLMRRHRITAAEAVVLATILRRAGRPCSYGSIMSALNECANRRVDAEPEMKIVQVFMCKVRRKLPAWAEIETVWGFGYVIAPDIADRLMAGAPGRPPRGR